MLLLAASLFFTNPIPLEMPRASGYLVTEGTHRRFEDRFNRFDLWLTQSVDGRWVDDEGRTFILAHLDTLPPLESATEETTTRASYEATKEQRRIDKRDKESLRIALAALSPVEVPEKETRPRQLPRGYKDVDYWQGTNTSAIVCAYLPEEESVWRLAIWQLVEGDDFDEKLKSFEKEFLASSEPPNSSSVALAKEEPPKPPKPSKLSKPSKPPKPSKLSKPPKPSELSLLRRDTAHAVALYPAWHTTDADELSIVDDIADRSFISTLTNDLPVMRRAFAKTLPTSIDTTNTLAVARIFANRDEYLEALAVDGLSNMTWSAAYWSPLRRELVAYYPSASLSSSPSTSTFISTIRHESFHQYLSYATALLSVSPWLNEGYAQYFEEGAEGPSFVDPADLTSLSSLIPSILMMDYEEFYAGTDFERRLKYRLALTIVYFLEKGAPKVRFQPFKEVKNNYFTALFETKDMRKATTAAFKDADTLKAFVKEWTKFWKDQ